MKRYVIRRNPGTGRWILYARSSGIQNWPTRLRPVYIIIGNMDTLANAIDGVYS